MYFKFYSGSSVGKNWLYLYWFQRLGIHLSGANFPKQHWAREPMQACWLSVPYHPNHIRSSARQATDFSRPWMSCHQDRHKPRIDLSGWSQTFRSAVGGWAESQPGSSCCERAKASQKCILRISWALVRGFLFTHTWLQHVRCINATNSGFQPSNRDIWRARHGPIIKPKHLQR